MTDFIAAQTQFERTALALLERDGVRSAIARLAEYWRTNTPGMSSETYAQLPESINEVALLVALQIANSDAYRPGVVEISSGPHSWGGIDVPGGRWGINNPDTTYFAIPVSPDSQYVLRGRPHQQGDTPIDINISVQTPDVWHVLDNLGHTDLAYASDGTFTVTVGSATATGDHLPVRPGGAVLLIRQTLADWSTELPYTLTVERTGGPVAAAKVSDNALAEQLIERLGRVIDHNLTTLQPPIFAREVNTIAQPGPAGDKSGYLTAQRSTLGQFRLGDKDALIIELFPGTAGYAAIATTNIWGVTTNSDLHQNSLNSHQAVAEEDGRITIVVSNSDPGVANWVDPGGLHEGIVMLRWQLLTARPDINHEPGVTVRLTTLAEAATSRVPVRQCSGASSSRGSSHRSDAYRRRFIDR